jgi:hypothetical protein
MLEKVKTMKGYQLRGLDGKIGSVEELYFDDHHWTIRYLVADTGNWLSGREVLISPYALGDVNSDEKYIDVDLTKKQIERSPSLATDRPVSQQFEASYYEFYGWPNYWNGPFMWGTSPYILRNIKRFNRVAKNKKAWDPHLRSSADVTGHHIQALDGGIGHVADFIIDDETWAIRYLVVKTRNWWPGKLVLISPRWIKRVDWNESKVFVGLTREVIKQSPPFTPGSLVTRDYEIGLHLHYGQPRRA